MWTVTGNEWVYKDVGLLFIWAESRKRYDYLISILTPRAAVSSLDLRNPGSSQSKIDRGLKHQPRAIMATTDTSGDCTSDRQLQHIMKSSSHPQSYSTCDLSSSSHLPPLSSMISAHDFEYLARQHFSTKAFAFYSSAADDLVSQRANISCLRQLLLRPRVLRNVQHASTKRKILGCESAVPFFVSPAAMAALAHPEGEKAIARACGDAGVMQGVRLRDCDRRG